jgi:hypothetical protein
MGWTPRELDRVTLWEWECAWVAWKKFHTASGEEEEKPPEISDERMAELGIVGFN